MTPSPKHRLLGLLQQRMQQETHLLTHSWRWKLGNRMVRLGERILGRKKPHSLPLQRIQGLLDLQAKLLDSPPKASKQGLSNDTKASIRQKLETGQLHITFLVSEAGSEAQTGDYFTALELGEACKEAFGWQFTFQVRGQAWQAPPKDSLLVALLPDYFPFSHLSSESSYLSIAWARNWFDLWASQEDFSNFHLFLSSSPLGLQLWQMGLGIEGHFFPLATNPKRFQSGNVQPRLQSELTFSGNHWGEKRELIQWLKAEELIGSFKIWGKGWENDPKMAPFAQGFLPYSRMPDLYASVDLVLDDANHATKSWGSVNSRVFDALGTGKLVITNGKEGVSSTFSHEVPTFSHAEELHQAITFFLQNPTQRQAKAQQLQMEVLNQHTYLHRAHKLKELISNVVSES
jgi:hypothetical protein